MTEKEFENSSQETVLDEKPSEEVKEEAAVIEEPEMVTEIKEEIVQKAEEIQPVIEEVAEQVSEVKEEAVEAAEEVKEAVEETVQAAEDRIIEHVDEKVEAVQETIPEDIVVDKIEEVKAQRPKTEPVIEKVPEESKPYTPTLTLENTARDEAVLQRELKKMRDSYRQQAIPQQETVRNNNSLNSVFLILLALLTVLLSVGGSYLVTTMVNKKNTPEPVVIYESVETPTVTLTYNDLSPVVANIENSVVEVYTEMVKYGGFYGEYVTGGAGSGVIYTTDGYIVTNNHVIEDARSINVKLHDGTEYTAELIATDEESDLAVIKINATGLQPVVVGDSEKLKVGETVIAIGNPLGTLGGTVTTGIVSALSREITVEGQKMTLLQTDTAISPGNSGGGLFNTSGELIAIVNAKSADDDAEGIGFAIPANVVKGVVQDLVTHGYVTGRPSIGIKCVSIESQRYMAYYGVSSYGVFVSEVVSERAKEAGLQPEDLIVEIEGKTVSSTTTMKDILYGFKAGDVISVTVLRGRQKVTLNIPLVEKNAINN